MKYYMFNPLQVFSFKSILFFLLIMLFGRVTSAQQITHKWEIKPNIGLSQAEFNWSIAGNLSGTSPNILSELIWKNLRGPDFGLDVQYQITDRLYIKAATQYTDIVKGDAEDTDYADDNRKNAFYYDLFDADKGYLLSTQVQLKYRALNFGLVSIFPIIAFTYNQHQFNLLENAGNTQAIGLNSTYQTKYNGFDFGVETILKTKKFYISAGILNGFYSYSAKANWNLIPAFEKPVSFTQKANSYALTGYASVSIPVNKDLQFSIDYQINNVNTKKGIDRAYLIGKNIEETRFNGANFRINTIAFGFNFLF
ncbi:hypothetical protein ACEN2P_04730 [Pedobacter psychrotolerans]|uniref:hypothetical protein n=1 Tax=Pedobacter psychrotolerans TaxID=1843235 RepID=UPI003F9AB107